MRLRQWSMPAAAYLLQFCTVAILATAELSPADWTVRPRSDRSAVAVPQPKQAGPRGRLFSTGSCQRTPYFSAFSVRSCWGARRARADPFVRKGTERKIPKGEYIFARSTGRYLDASAACLVRQERVILSS